MSEGGHGHHGAIESSGKESGGFIPAIAEMAKVGVDLEQLTEAAADEAGNYAGPDQIQGVIKTEGELAQTISVFGAKVPGAISAGGKKADAGHPAHH
jgi:hypothetical protein